VNPPHLNSSPPHLIHLFDGFSPRRMERSGGGRKDPTCLMGALLDKAFFLFVHVENYGRGGGRQLVGSANHPGNTHLIDM